MANDTIGIFYELPDGRIANTYGWDGQKGIVNYYFDDDAGGREVSEADFQTWTPRKDLEDFPNAKDPKLPYVFDLLWGVKHESELRQILTKGHRDIEEIRETVVDHGLERLLPENQSGSEMEMSQGC